MKHLAATDPKGVRKESQAERVRSAKREAQRAKKQLAEGSEPKKPAEWNTENTVSAEVQCPPKKRGRKPKAKDDTEPPKKPRAKAAAKAKGKAKAKAKAKAKGTATKKRKAQEVSQDAQVAPEKKPSKAKAKAKGKTSKPNLKEKAKREDLGVVEAGLQEAQAEEEKAKIEKKKLLSRKSSAYHKAFLKAKKEGCSEEDCKKRGKAVLYLN